MRRASRHHGIEAARGGAAFACRLSPRRPRGFSLVEVLLAIIILGIGVISIAALFPAGIAQQRLSGDDFMGPVVADQAISVLRSKVSSEDFGTFDEFHELFATLNPQDATRTVRGDWGWMRPSFLTGGTIDIFSSIHTATQAGGFIPPNVEAFASEHWNGWGPFLYGIPYNTERYPPEIAEPRPPRIFVTQYERFYPMGSHLKTTASDPPRPQYVWECMFRRFEGRVLVAIFVYRVSASGGGAPPQYVVQRRPGDTSGVPPLPIAIDMVPDVVPDWPSGIGPWDVRYDATSGRPLPEVRGFHQSSFSVLEQNQSWQAPRQWILDQNNNIHRVVGNRRPQSGDLTDHMIVQLGRPLSPVTLALRTNAAGEAQKYNAAENTENGWPTFSAHEYYANPSGGPASPNLRFPLLDRGVVTRFWYMPLRMEYDLNDDDVADGEYVLTPVYVTVKEL